MDITLYEYEPTRSARVRWTLQELGQAFKSIEGVHLVGSDELRKVHPMAKLPAVLIDGEALFESAAICTHLADCHPEKGLVPATGTRQRALHEQWTAFVLSEVEAHSWSSFRNTVIYPEEKRVPAIIAQNDMEQKRGVAVLDEALAGRDYLLGDAFQVTDIIVGYAVNNARRSEKFGDDMPNLLAWTDRLRARPLSTLAS
jgi:glutathione S-transferase